MTKICVQCGKEFTPRAGYENMQLYCSTTCKKAFYNATRRAVMPRARYCVICGKKFTPREDRNITCSPACALANRKINAARCYHKRKILADTPPLYERNCLCCRRRFKQTFRNEKFCSDNCRLDYFQMR